MPNVAVSCFSTCSQPSAHLIEMAQKGCHKSRQEVIAWVYAEGLSYFRSKVPSETMLSYADAEDLAGESLLEFQKALPRIQQVGRYMRRMFRNNLIRHLSRKRVRRGRECLSEDNRRGVIQATVYQSYRRSTFLSWTDNELDMWHLSRRRLENAGPLLQKIFSFRMADEPLSYRQISSIVGMEEAALRMRVARFCRSVRDEYRLGDRRSR